MQSTRPSRRSSVAVRGKCAHQLNETSDEEEEVIPPKRHKIKSDSDFSTDDDFEQAKPEKCAPTHIQRGKIVGALPSVVGSKKNIRIVLVRIPDETLAHFKAKEISIAEKSKEAAATAPKQVPNEQLPVASSQSDDSSVVVHPKPPPVLPSTSNANSKEAAASIVIRRKRQWSCETKFEYTDLDSDSVSEPEFGGDSEYSAKMPITSPKQVPKERLPVVPTQPVDSSANVPPKPLHVASTSTSTSQMPSAAQEQVPKERVVVASSPLVDSVDLAEDDTIFDNSHSADEPSSSMSSSLSSILNKEAENFKAKTARAKPATARVRMPRGGLKKRLQLQLTLNRDGTLQKPQSIKKLINKNHADLKRKNPLNSEVKSKPENCLQFDRNPDDLGIEIDLEARQTDSGDMNSLPIETQAMDLDNDATFSINDDADYDDVPLSPLPQKKKSDVSKCRTELSSVAKIVADLNSDEDSGEPQPKMHCTKPTGGERNSEFAASFDLPPPVLPSTSTTTSQMCSAATEKQVPKERLAVASTQPVDSSANVPSKPPHVASTSSNTSHMPAATEKQVPKERLPVASSQPVDSSAIVQSKPPPNLPSTSTSTTSQMPAATEKQVPKERPIVASSQLVDSVDLAEDDTIFDNSHSADEPSSSMSSSLSSILNQKPRTENVGKKKTSIVPIGIFDLTRTQEEESELGPSQEKDTEIELKRNTIVAQQKEIEELKKRIKQEHQSDQMQQRQNVNIENEIKNAREMPSMKPKKSLQSGAPQFPRPSVTRTSSGAGGLIISPRGSSGFQIQYNQVYFPEDEDRNAHWPDEDSGEPQPKMHCSKPTGGERNSESAASFDLPPPVLPSTSTSTTTTTSQMCSATQEQVSKERLAVASSQPVDSRKKRDHRSSSSSNDDHEENGDVPPPKENGLERVWLKFERIDPVIDDSNGTARFKNANEIHQNVIGMIQSKFKHSSFEAMFAHGLKFMSGKINKQLHVMVTNATGAYIVNQNFIDIYMLRKNEAFPPKDPYIGECVIGHDARQSSRIHRIRNEKHINVSEIQIAEWLRQNGGHLRSRYITLQLAEAEPTKKTKENHSKFLEACLLRLLCSHFGKEMMPVNYSGSSVTGGISLVLSRFTRDEYDMMSVGVVLLSHFLDPASLTEYQIEKRARSTNTRPKDLHCPLCSSKFSSVSGLYVHKKRHHTIAAPPVAPTPKPFSCDMCSASYFHQEALIKHRQDKHDVTPHHKTDEWLNKDRPFQCPKCPKKYVQRQSLAKHEKHQHGSSQ